MQVLHQQLPSVTLHGLSWKPPASPSMQDLSADDLSAMIGSLHAGSFSNEIERSRARQVAKALLDRIETPWEATFNTVWAQVFLLFCNKADHAHSDPCLLLAGAWRCNQDMRRSPALFQMASCGRAAKVARGAGYPGRH